MQVTSLLAEYAAFAVMLGLSVIIGLYYGCVKGEQNTVKEYLLGSKHMSVFPIAVSLIASHVSGISLIGVPSEMYTHGTQYLIIILANVIVVVVVVCVFIPVFYDLQVTSVYEYLELRFDSRIRGLSSLMYAVSLILFIPVVIYLPALAVNQVTGLNVHLITSVLCTTCVFYTTIGGLKAVVWTDAIQSVFTLASLIIVIVLGLVRVGGLGNTIKANLEGGRIEFFKMDPDPFRRDTFWTVGIGLTLSSICGLGIHPGSVQRFVALPTLKKAKLSMLYFGLGLSVVKVMTGLVGLLIYAKYKDCDPTSANLIQSNRNLVPYFVMDVASKFPGLTGLFISGIVSAALSTMSAQLNTVSGTIYEDFIVKMMGIRLSDLTASIVMKCTVVVIGIVCTALVVVVERLKGILQLAISLSAITNGPTLAVFTVGVCFPWANSRGALCGMLTSLGLMSWIVYGAQYAIFQKELMFVEKNVSVAGCPTNITFKNHANFSGLNQINDDMYASSNVWKIYTLSHYHYITLGVVVGIAVSLVVSLLFPVDQDINPKLLSPFIRKFAYPEYMSDSKLEAKTREYELVPQETKL